MLSACCGVEAQLLQQVLHEEPISNRALASLVFQLPALPVAKRLRRAAGGFRKRSPHHQKRLYSAGGERFRGGQKRPVCVPSAKAASPNTLGSRCRSPAGG